MSDKRQSSGLQAGPLSHSSAERDLLWRAYAAKHPHVSADLRRVVENSLSIRFPAAVFWGRDLHFFYNSEYAALIGKRHPGAYGRPSNETDPENWEEFEPLIRGVLESGASILYEDFYVERERARGYEEFCFSFSMSAIVDEGGERLGVLCIAIDTTANVLQIRAANERISELNEFKKLADNVTDIVYMHGPDGTIAWANERWYSFTGLSRETSLSLEVWAQIMPAEDLAAYVTTLERALPSRQSYDIEVRLKSTCERDDYRLHFIRATPMYDGEGFLLRWAASATDIHDRREAEIAARTRLELDRDREHKASLAFQDAAMPKTLPSVPGLTFSAVYEPAGADSLVGGDWYDAFALSDGRIVLSVGDVMGSGLAAAVTMSAVRQAIRGAAQIYPHPPSILDAADRALRAEQPDRIVTAFVAVLDPLVLNLSFASAGHPSPMLRLPSGEIVELLAPDLPLGLRSEIRGNAPLAQVKIPTGSQLVMFTDGLTETTKDIFEGEALLRGALSNAAHVDPTALAQHIRDTVLKSSNDDVAILTVSFAETGGLRAPAAFDSRTRWSFPIADSGAAVAVRREIVAALQRLGATPAEAADAELVIGELLGNVMRHASGDVQLVLDVSGASPVVHVLDDGDGFTFHARLPRDEMSESGRGLYIASRLTSDLSVVPRPEGGSHARAVLRTSRRRA